MLRKVTHILIAITLILATAGVSVSRHYCGGSLISVSVYHHAKSCCDANCHSCHNETNVYQLTDKFNFEASDFNFQSHATDAGYLQAVLPTSVLPQTVTLSVNTSFYTAAFSFKGITMPMLQVFRC
jgi:hypothetical protein